jgi:hypothetical protein
MTERQRTPAVRGRRIYAFPFFCCPTDVRVGILFLTFYTDSSVPPVRPTAAVHHRSVPP